MKESMSENQSAIPRHFRKGEHVEFTNTKTGEVISGIIISPLVKGNKATLRDDKEPVKWTVSLFLLRPSNKPLPDYLATPNPFLPGMRVEWTKKDGSIRHGTVTGTRNERVTVDIDESPGYTTSATHTFFRKTTVPAPAPKPAPAGRLVETDPPCAMDAYSVAKFRHYNIGHEGGVVKATIALNGKPVVLMEADANGGPTEFSPSPGRSAKDVENFFAAMKDTWFQFGGKENGFHDDVVADVWVAWYWNDRPKEKMWKDEVKQMQAFSDECDAKFGKTGGEA